MTRRRGNLARCVVPWALLLLFMSAGVAVAQDSGPLVVGEQEKPPPFALYNYWGYAEFLWIRQDQSLDPTDGDSQDLTENRFEQTLTLECDGHIYHPNFIELNLAATIGFTQTQLDTNGDTEDRNGFINEYDLSATLLRKEKAPLTVYARRAQDQVNREFGPTLDFTIMTEGAIWDIRSEKIPTRFEIFTSNQEQSGLGDDIGDFTLNQNTFLWHSETRPSARQIITWDYTLSQVSEETQGFASNDYILNDANFVHSIDFGRAGQHNLTSALQFFDQTGDNPLLRARWDELLRLRHTPNFETRYQYTLDYQDFADLAQLRNRGIAGFTHRLYKSLITSGNVGIEYIDYSDDSDSLNVFSDLNFDYTKQVPMGTLSAFLGLAYDWQKNDDTVTPTPIINQPRTFNDPAPITIIDNGIDPNSIIITDVSGLITYQEGLDYTITVIPGGVQIFRVVGGRIANGQTVLIDYLLVPQAANTVTTTVFSIGGRYDIEQGFLRGLSLYGRYTDQNQTVESDDPGGFIPNSFTDIILGVEYRIWAITVGTEWQRHDSTVSPFDSNRYFITYAQRITDALTLNANATYTQLYYPDIDNNVDLLTVTGFVAWRVTRELSVVASILWQDEQDDLSGPTQGLEEQVQVNWTHRQTTFYALFRNTTLETDFQDNSFQYVEIGLRREF